MAEGMTEVEALFKAGRLVREIYCSERLRKALKGWNFSRPGMRMAVCQ